MKLSDLVGRQLPLLLHGLQMPVVLHLQLLPKSGDHGFELLGLRRSLRQCRLQAILGLQLGALERIAHADDGRLEGADLELAIVPDRSVRSGRREPHAATLLRQVRGQQLSRPVD